MSLHFNFINNMYETSYCLFEDIQNYVDRQHYHKSLCSQLVLNIKSHEVTKRFPMGVGISRKSMVGFEGLWTHNIS